MTTRNALINRLIDNFTYLWFLMSLGLGGTAIAGYAFLNYTLTRPEGMNGLLHFGNMGDLVPQMGWLYELFYQYLQVHILVFALLHLITISGTVALYVAWQRRHPEKVAAIRRNPASAPMTIAPVLAFGMTFNVLLVPSFAYVEWVRMNLQSLIYVGFAVWFVIWLWGMIRVLNILKAFMAGGSDPTDVHFGWMMIPMAMAMISVSGAAIAAMTTDPMLSRVVFFLTLAPFTMAMLLLMMNFVLLFQAHFNYGLPGQVERLPSMLAVMPVVTLLSVTLYRYGHFFEKQFDAHMSPAYFVLVIAGGWAFQMWYAGIGLFMLSDYLRNFLFGRYFHESQWALVCPVVSAAVLGAFFYDVFLPSPAVLALVGGLIILDVLLLVMFIGKQIHKLIDPTISEIPNTEPAPVQA